MSFFWFVIRLEPWIRTVAFRDDELRESVPYFYHTDRENEQLNEKIFGLFNKYLVLFLRYVRKHKNSLKIGVYGGTLDDFAQRFSEILQHKNVQNKIKKKLRKHYQSTVQSFNGVYTPKKKDVSRVFKRISWSMRLDDLRIKLRNIKWEY